MTKKPDGGPAFPMPSGPDPRVNVATHYNEGMSLRDLFALGAMNGLISNVYYMQYQGPSNARDVAKDAYIYADAMIQEREKERQE